MSIGPGSEDVSPASALCKAFPNRANLRNLEGVISQRDVLDRYRDFGGE